jgi:hypothetical protein
MRRLGLAPLILTASASSALAAERGYSVTDFDRIDVTGSYVVIVETGKSPSVRASGSSEGIERLSVQTIGKTLKIKPNAGGWGGWPGAKAAAPSIRVTVPNLRDAQISGSGSLSISKMRAQVVKLGLAGSGQLSVAQLETDRLFASMVGSGTMTLTGKAAIGRLSTEGSGTLNGKALKVDNLDLISNSAGPSHFVGGKTAKVTSTGAGEIEVSGTPACTVNATGSGLVSCGR